MAVRELDRAQPASGGFYRPWMALLGIPPATLVAIMCALELSRVVYGAASPPLLALELLSLAALSVQVVLLRARLAAAPVSQGLFGDLLDLFAFKRWHPAVITAFLAIVTLPLAWWATGNHWLFGTLQRLGSEALGMSDVHAALDSGVIACQHTLVAGLPLVGLLHLVCRRRPQSRVLPWLLVPLLLLSTVIGFMILVTIMHFAH